MIGRTHSLAAFTALGVVYFSLQPQTISLATLLVALFANQAGSIAPDIDQPTAPFWRNLPVGGIIGRIINKLLGGHRFITHSLLGVALFGLLAYWLLVFIHPIVPKIDNTLVWIAFMIGMLSHLIMDTFTKEGVPWLLPIPIKFGFLPIRRLRITTDKKVENLIVAPAFVLIIIGFCATHYNEILTLLHFRIT